ncbi:hypothetical protein JCM11251_003006 [Rhodosporidiobolus azoricus]
MPTIEDYADPSDDELPLDAPAPSSLDQGHPAGDFGGTIPKALRIGYDGSLRTVTAEEFKGWETIYPIYVDAKRPQQDGARRVNSKTAVQWPQAEQMAKACRQLGFETVFEPSKTHPKDWENPGRVRVMLKREDGKPQNSTIKNKRILLTRICDMLRPFQPTAPPATESNPNPIPPIYKRLPPNSPAISHGTLDDAIKGGGPLGALGGMFGGGGDEDAIAKAEADRQKKKDEEAKKQKEMMAKMKSLKKVHVKRR